MKPALCLLAAAALLFVSLLPAAATELSGETLLFISDTDSLDARRGSNSIYRIGLDGAGMKRIVGSIPHGDGYLLISDIDCLAAAQSLMIASYRQDLNGFHHALLDGTGLHLDRPATGNLLSAVRQISQAPDGIRLIVSREFGNHEPPRFGLVIGDIGSRQYKSIKRPSESRSYIAPAWSPDGARIAYIIESRAANAKMTYALALVDAEGEDERIVYETAWTLRDLAWSPDGRWLALVMNSQIYKLRADGSGLSRLSEHVGGASRPRWSPDGRRISYVAPSSFAGIQQIFAMNADGSGKQRIANIRGDVALGCWL